MTRTADVLIQAGHEGRTSGATGAAAHGLREIELTPRIADAAVRWLTDRGVSVIRDTAVTSEARVKIAVGVHLDGNPAAGAQLLYDDDTDRPLANHLRRVWAVDAGYPEWIADNTSPLADDAGFSRYYGFRHWITTDGEVVFEFGSIGDPTQAALWSQTGYPEHAGRWLGHAIALRLGVSSTPPGGFGETGTPIVAAASVTLAQATAWLRRRGAHDRLVNVAAIYFDTFTTLGIDPAVGIAQAAKETAFGTFLRPDGRPSPAVTPDHHNWCGLKTHDGGGNDDPNAHARFPDDRSGILAHRDHLHLYSVGPVAGTLDPRHFPYLAGIAPTALDLSGRWAGPTYGESLETYIADLRATVVAPGDVWADRLDWPPYARAAIERVIAKGLIVGKPTVDGSLEFDPAAPVTRAQLAVILDRAGLT
jgi:hypothetical protein